jgi:hypothetical protein
MEKYTLWIILGIIFIGLIGPVLHFAYSTTPSLLIALFAPINESPWEHLKLTFWPAMLFLIFEYFFLYRKHKPSNFNLGRTIGILLMPLVIIIFFYTYTAFTPGHESILGIDILSFYIGVIVGQAVSWKFYKSKPFSEKINKFISLALIAMAIIFIIFTFYPPHLLPFQDPNDFTYGVFKLL